MNSPSTPPPLASPPPKQRGCLGVLVWVLLGLGVFMLLLVGGLYYAVMHTSLPFKMIESMFASAGTNANFKVEGISGSISSGFKIKSIRWGQDDAGAGEISDVRVAYSGFWDLISGNRVIFREIHVGKAHLDITGLENFISNANAQPTVTWTAPAPTARQGSRLFQIDKVSIADIFITNRVTGFSLAIPSVTWTGFKAANGQVELGELKVESDRLKITTKPGRTVDIGGQPIAFQKLLEGTLFPSLHKSIRQPIEFSADIAYAQSNLTWRATAFDRHLDIYVAPDRGGYVRCKGLDLAGYFDAPLPQDLTVDAVMAAGLAPGRERLQLNKGSFTMGTRAFAFEPGEVERIEGVPQTNSLVAISQSAGETFTYELIIPDELWRIQQNLSSDPPMTIQDTAAKVFFGKPYADLGPDQQKDIGGKLPAFSGWKQPEASEPNR